MLIYFLLLFPLAVGILILAFPQFLSNYLIKISTFIVGGASLMLLGVYLQHDSFLLEGSVEWINGLMLLIELAVAVYLVVISVQYKKFLVTLLVVLSTVVLVGLELTLGSTISEIAVRNLFIDHLSLIMALIVGVVGSIITYFAIGYMKEYHHHLPELNDRRRFFFFIVFIFLSAMFGVVFSNNLLWLYFFWEITTLSSFFLIGYKQDEQSRNNAFHALQLNLLGGLAFIIAITYLVANHGIIELDKMLLAGKAACLIPAILMSFAGLTKAAQLPFSSWLLGAMVAPTPVSALLHSSTMVKAGVYIILKMAVLLTSTWAGTAIALIGGLTFVITSFLAIAQSDAKKVLAYSTIANLGLIVACGGVGTYEAVWAGILLIIFHALAKGLLFLCVGAAEHGLDSRDIEDMDGLIVSMPRVAWMMLVGMAGMFLAPFGMLISKWAVLKAFLDANPLLALCVILGSAATLFFWVKWMGKLLMVVRPNPGTEAHLHSEESKSLYVLAFLTIGICFAFPLVSSVLIQPYVISVFGHGMSLGRGNIMVMMMMLGMIVLFPLSLPGAKDKSVDLMDPYLSGANTEGGASFTNSLGGKTSLRVSNYYFEKYFGESVLLKPGMIAASVLILSLFWVVLK